MILQTEHPPNFILKFTEPLYAKNIQSFSTLSPPSSKKQCTPCLLLWFFLPPTTSPRPFGLFFLDDRSAIGFSNLQVIEIKETTAFAWFLRLLACSDGKSTYPPIKGNQWSTSPDHKAGYFWGGTRPRPGGGRLTSHQTGFLEIHLEWFFGFLGKFSLMMDLRVIGKQTVKGHFGRVPSAISVVHNALTRWKTTQTLTSSQKKTETIGRWCSVKEESIFKFYVSIEGSNNALKTFTSGKKMKDPKLGDFQNSICCNPKNPPILSSWWLNQPIWKICASQIGSSPHLVVQIKNVWNHLLVTCWSSIEEKKKTSTILIKRKKTWLQHRLWFPNKKKWPSFLFVKSVLNLWAAPTSSDFSSSLPSELSTFSTSLAVSPSNLSSSKVIFLDGLGVGIILRVLLGRGQKNSKRYMHPFF